MKFSEIEQWNAVSYGSALKIKKWQLMSIVTIVCLITPFTNWLIPVAAKFIPTTIMVRY